MNMVDYITPISNVLSGRMAVLVAAIAILLIGVLLARFISKLTQKLLQEIQLNKILKNELGIKLPLEEIISRLKKRKIDIKIMIPDNENEVKKLTKK